MHVRILSTSDQTQIVGAQTVVAMAKAVTSVADLELPHVDSESPTSKVHRNHLGEEHEETLPSPRRRTEEESHVVAKLLHHHKDVFSYQNMSLAEPN